MNRLKLIVQALELRESWMEEVMARIALKDQVEGVKRKRRLTFQKLQRLGKAYVDGVYQEKDYKREKRRLELDLESLVVPQVSAAEEAGNLLKALSSLWAGATTGERRKLLLAMLDGVYIETKELKRVVAIQPKPAFRPIFEVANMKAGSGFSLIKEPPADAQEAQMCLWWRRRRVELLPEHELDVWLIIKPTINQPTLLRNIVQVCGKSSLSDKSKRRTN